MLTIKGVDYAWGSPPLEEFKRRGIRFVMRYLSHDPSKDLDAAELKAIRAHGLSVGVVWETTANRAAQGNGAGRADAREAIRRVRALGLNDIPIYFAVDFDASGPEVAAYFHGVEAVLGHERTGVYGGWRVIDYLSRHKICRFYWQTLAWSGGRVHPAAHIYQNQYEIKIGGLDCDGNVATNAGSFGVFPDISLKHVPFASRTLKNGVSGTDVREFQGHLNERLRARKRKTIDGDGHYGPTTIKARHDVVYALGFPVKDVHEEISRTSLQKIVKNPKLRPPSYLVRAVARKVIKKK